MNAIEMLTVLIVFTAALFVGALLQEHYGSVGFLGGFAGTLFLVVGLFLFLRRKGNSKAG